MENGHSLTLPAEPRPSGPKYYASIIGPDGKEMRVLVIPVKEEEEKPEPQKPVAIVQPTGPTLPTKTKTKARKKARLNGLIDRLAAKKGPTKPHAAANEAEFKKIPEKSPEALELNYNKYNVKTKDGELGKITILHRFNENEELNSDALKKVDQTTAAVTDTCLDLSEQTPSTSDAESHKSSVVDDDSVSKETPLSPYTNLQSSESHTPPPLEEICSRASTPDYSALIYAQNNDITSLVNSAPSSPIQASTVGDTPTVCSKPVQNTSTSDQHAKDPSTKIHLVASSPETEPTATEMAPAESLTTLVDDGMDYENDDQPLDQLETIKPAVVTPAVTAPVTRPETDKQPDNSPKFKKSLEHARIIAQVDVCIPSKPKVVRNETHSSRTQLVQAPTRTPTRPTPIRTAHTPTARTTHSPTKSPGGTPRIVGPVVASASVTKTPSPQKQSGLVHSIPVTLPAPVTTAISPIPVKPINANNAVIRSPVPKVASPPLASGPSPANVSPQAVDASKRPKQFKAINMFGRNIISSCVVKNKLKVPKPGVPVQVSTTPSPTSQLNDSVSPKSNVPPHADEASIPTVNAVTSIIRPSPSGAPVSVIHKNPTHQTAHPQPKLPAPAMRPNRPPPPPPQQAETIVVQHHPHTVSNDDQPIRHIIPPQRIPSNPSHARPKVVHQKYPPPTPVEGLHGGQSKWPAIKTIKMANGETCGIKVQSPSVFTKVNIPNAKLREVKQQIAMQEAKKKRNRDYRVNKPTYHGNNHPMLNNDKSKTITVPINPRPVEQIERIKHPVPSLPAPPAPTPNNTSPTAAKTPTKPLSQNFLSRYAGKVVGTAKLSKNDLIRTPEFRSPKNSTSSTNSGKNDFHDKPINTEQPITDFESGFGGEVRDQTPAIQSASTSSEVQSSETASAAPGKQQQQKATPSPAQSLVLSAENQALVRKYIEQHPCGKMDFALSPVHPGTTINPAFPLVKVGSDDFQLIPKDVIMQKMQEEQKRQLVPKVLAPIQPKPDEVAQPAIPTTTATVTTSRWRTNAIGEPELVDDISVEDDDGEPKKISLRTLSASSSGSPVKPVTVVGMPQRNEDHSESDDDTVLETFPSSAVVPPSATYPSPTHTLPPPPLPSAANHAPAPAPTVVPPPAPCTTTPSPSTELAILPSTTATVTPGNIANQIHNRHKRQPMPQQRRKERPKKIKKISYIGKAKLAPLLPQPDKNGHSDGSKDSNGSKSDDEPITIVQDSPEYEYENQEDDIDHTEYNEYCDGYEPPYHHGYDHVTYDESVQCNTLEPVHYADTSYDHIIVSNPGRMETLEEIQAKINQEIKTSTPVIPDSIEDEDGDLVIDEQPDRPATPSKGDKSTSSEFSVPKSPVGKANPSPVRIPKSSTPKKNEEYRYPSGPYIETDSDATPTKPKHIRMSTSSEDSVFLPATAPQKIMINKRKKSLPSHPEEPVLEPIRKRVPTPPPKEEDESAEYDSDEEMDSDFDDMPDLEETPTDSFIDDLPMLEEINPLPKPAKKRKSLPTQPPPVMSPVKRHRRGIRRTKSAVEQSKWEGSSQKRDKAENGSSSKTESTTKNVKLTSLIEKTRQILKEKRNQKRRNKPNSESSSSDNENLATVRARIKRQKMKRSKKIKLDDVVKKLHQSHSENSHSSEPESVVEKPRIVPNGEAAALSDITGSGGSSSEGILHVDFSADAIRRRKRILERLADTPEYREARCSASGRSRRSNIARPSREAARTASESIQKNAKDERGRLKLTVEPEKIPKPEVKVEPKTSPVVKPPRQPKRKRPEKKTPLTPVSKKARDQIEKDHGWIGTGESERRPILKPGESTYVERLCFDGIRDNRTGREIKRRDSVVVYAGDDCPPYYAKIGDFYKDQWGSLMAWIYWYYRRDDVDAPTSTYTAGDDEIIASRHHDSISVATILTKFSVLTFNQYCRYRARQTLQESSYFPVDAFKSKLGELMENTEEYSSQVFFCRRFYDNSSRSIVVMPSFLRSKEVQSTKTDNVIKLRPR